MYKPDEDEPRVLDGAELFLEGIAGGLVFATIIVLWFLEVF